MKNANHTYEKSDYLINIANKNITDILGKENIGIKSEDRKRIQTEQGDNKVVAKKYNYIKKIMIGLFSEFNILLMIIALIEFLLFIYEEHDFLYIVSSVFVLIMVFISTLMFYINDILAYKTNLKLLDIVENNVLVINRNFNIDKKSYDIDIIKEDLVSIHQSELVVGDVVYLTSGDVVPADAKIIWLHDLQVNQSALTGEADTVEKNIDNNKKELIELENILFANTEITAGACLCVVVNVGTDNYSTSFITSKPSGPTNFEKRMEKITKILMISIICSLPIIYAINYFNIGNGDWVHPLVFSISIAVGIIPESLTAIIAFNMQIGSKFLSKNKVLVKDLNVVQDLGAVNLLCTDKTGTLTNDNISLDGFWDIERKKSEELKTGLYLNSHYQKVISNKIDGAIRKSISDHSWTEFNNWELISEKEFDFNNRTASVIVKNKKESMQITKGSYEEMLSMVDKARVNGKIVKLDGELKNKIENIVHELSVKGCRSIVIASAITDDYVDQGMVYEGVAWFTEVLKENTVKTVQEILHHDIQLKVLTGDNKEITQNLAHKLGFESDNVVFGSELNGLSDEEVIKLIKDERLFVKLSPYDKARIVSIYRELGNTVAFIGDGINDTLAIKGSDVGISVNNGTSLAKSQASIILLEKDLSVINAAFILGRKIFFNGLKYINITIASHVGLLLTILFSTFWLKFDVATPLQLIIQNILFDIINLFFVFDKVEDREITKPIVYKTKLLMPFAFWHSIGLIIISFTNFMIMAFVFKLVNADGTAVNSASKQIFQTSYFCELMFSHIVLVLSLRSSEVFLFRALPSVKLFIPLMAGAIFTILLIILLGHIKEVEFAILPMKSFLVLFALIIPSFIIQEISKKLYIKTFKQWI